MVFRSMFRARARHALAPILRGHLCPLTPGRGIVMPQRWLNALWLGKPRRQPRQRLVRYFDCTWMSAWGQERARVSSLSPTGCYIESRFSVPPAGEVVRELTIALPSGQVKLHGTVIDAMSGVGFAVRFNELDTKSRERLSALIDIARRLTPEDRWGRAAVT